jgi:hypothetical protein
MSEIDRKVPSLPGIAIIQRGYANDWAVWQLLGSPSTLPGGEIC